MSDLLTPGRLPVYDAGRGGQYTYHGPGQRVAYVMLDLRERGRDIRCLVRGLETWIIDTLAAAYAAAGAFDRATEAARSAIAAAERLRLTDLSNRIAARLRLYERSQPYVER